MDSIKNAIVTVTLLAVGYGSYVVLQDDLPGKSGPQDAPVADADDPGEGLEITVGEPTTLAETTASPGVPDAFRQGPSEDFASSATGLDDPLPANPFADSPLQGSDVAPPVAERSADTAPLEGPAQPEPNTGPFSSPVVVTADPLSPQDTESDIAKTDTVPGNLVSELSDPPVNAPLGPIPPSEASEGSLVFEKDWAKAQQEMGDGALAAALTTLSKWAADCTLNSEQRDRCIRVLDELAGSVIYSREHHLEPEYVVKAGETLAEISSTYQVPESLLAKINGVAPPFALTTGEKLKVVPGPFRAELSLGKNELTLFLGTYYAGRFPISVGPDIPPEAAVYEVAEKTNGRNYFDRRSGTEVKLGDKANRYGNHWLGLRGEHITTGHSVGIHGRPLQASSEREGSIGLDPLDAEDIYSILSVGSQVTVQP